MPAQTDVTEINMRRILLVEDDPIIGKSLGFTLKQEGFAVDLAPTINAALELLEKWQFSLILLDINLPDGNGFSICEQIQLREDSPPVLILTARSDENSAVHGFQLGAVDYVRKPFGNKELLARIQRFFKKQQKQLVFGQLVLDQGTRQIQIGTHSIPLSPREYDVLRLLMTKDGEIASREEILCRMSKSEEIFDRTIDSYISHLRTKLKSLSNDSIRISTVYGAGYRLTRDD